MNLRLSLSAYSQFSNLSNWNLTNMAAAAINLIMVVSSILFVFQLFIGGFKFMLAAGEKEATHSATRTIANAFIGLLIVFGSYAIMDIVSSFLGVPLLQFTIISVS